MGAFESYRQALDSASLLGLVGRVSAVRGLTASVSDFPAPVGSTCRIFRAGGPVNSRVIGFADDQTLVMPLGQTDGICRGDRVEFVTAQQCVGVSQSLLGRVLDANLQPLDDGPAISPAVHMPLWPAPLSPLKRQRLDQPLPTGVRAIDAMTTIGRGQRMGIFSGSGVGKSVLLGMIARGTSADVTVIALVGERGREVKDFLDRELDSDSLRRCVVVVATSDEPPLMRVQAAAAATCVAEFFRDQGRDVLLVMDSVTRLAMAQRQVGLVAGEPPATKGFPPSVFSLLPQLLERSGRTDKGSITGFYSVLVEGDDLTEPISDAVRSTTDGHIVLSRSLAQRGHYPAIDPLASISRVMSDIVRPGHIQAAAAIRKLLAVYAEVEELVSIGAYQAGARAEYDLAIQVAPWIRALLAQEISQSAPFEHTLRELEQLHQRMLAEHRRLNLQTQRKIALRRTP